MGMFAWCVSYGGGLGVRNLGEAKMHGSALGWGMLNGINSCLGVTSALLVNVSTRRPRRASLSIDTS
jgi:NCS1 family nucleobase:cation symporter-1